MTGHRAFDEQKVLFGEHFQDFEAADFYLDVAHLTAHAHAFHDFGGERGVAEGAGCAQAVVLSVPGRVLLFLATLAVFYHLCNGIRHLIWDSVRAFELRSIYAGGWAVVAASLILTAALWLWVLA